MPRPAAILATVPLALLAACGVAWAQEAAPPLSAGLGELGTGAGGGLLIVGLDRLIGYLRQSKADERADAAQAKRDADRAELRAEIVRIRDIQNAQAGLVGRLDERLTAQADQARQLHADLSRIGDKLDDIRDTLPPRP